MIGDRQPVGREQLVDFPRAVAADKEYPPAGRGMPIQLGADAVRRPRIEVLDQLHCGAVGGMRFAAIATCLLVGDDQLAEGSF